MNRLPAFGIALIVAAILSVAAPASADPFLVRSAPLTQGGRTPSLTSLPGWTVEWYGRDFGEAPLTSLGNREQSFSVFRDEFPQLNRGGQVNLSKGVSFGGSSVSAILPAPLRLVRGGPSASLYRLWGHGRPIPL